MREDGCHYIVVATAYYIKKIENVSLYWFFTIKICYDKVLTSSMISMTSVSGVISYMQSISIEEIERMPIEEMKIMYKHTASCLAFVKSKGNERDFATVEGFFKPVQKVVSKAVEAARVKPTKVSKDVDVDVVAAADAPKAVVADQAAAKKELDAKAKKELEAKAKKDLEAEAEAEAAKAEAAKAEADEWWNDYNMSHNRNHVKDMSDQNIFNWSDEAFKSMAVRETNSKKTVTFADEVAAEKVTKAKADEDRKKAEEDRKKDLEAKAKKDLEAEAAAKAAEALKAANEAEKAKAAEDRKKAEAEAEEDRKKAEAEKAEADRLEAEEVEWWNNYDMICNRNATEARKKAEAEEDRKKAEAEKAEAEKAEAEKAEAEKAEARKKAEAEAEEDRKKAEAEKAEAFKSMAVRETNSKKTTTFAVKDEVAKAVVNAEVKTRADFLNGIPKTIQDFLNNHSLSSFQELSDGEFVRVPLQVVSCIVTILNGKSERLWYAIIEKFYQYLGDCEISLVKNKNSLVEVVTLENEHPYIMVHIEKPMNDGVVVLKDQKVDKERNESFEEGMTWSDCHKEVEGEVKAAVVVQTGVGSDMCRVFPCTYHKCCLTHTEFQIAQKTKDAMEYMARTPCRNEKSFGCCKMRKCGFNHTQRTRDVEK